MPPSRPGLVASYSTAHLSAGMRDGGTALKYCKLPLNQMHSQKTQEEF